MTISREGFRERFRETLEAANVGAPLKPVALADQIELHLHGVHDCTFDKALSELWISQDAFFRVIDVSVHPKRDGWFFVRPSGHEPGPLAETRNHLALPPFTVMVPA